MSIYRVQVAKRGLITLPQEMRRRNNIQEGEILTLLDLGGVFVLVPRELESDRIAERLAEKWRNRGENLETMLRTLREVRDEYAADR